MAFKGMGDRYEENVKALYARSTREGGPSGRNEQPFIEIKPTDANKRETANDSQFLPIGSIKRDLKRIGGFIKSNTGILFLVKQQTLQLGNTFSETRLLNPLFVIGNVVPFVHIRRPLSTPAGSSINDIKKTAVAIFKGGSLSEQSPSPASFDSKIGKSGRLQRATMRDVTGKVMGTTGTRGLLNMLPPNRIINAINGVLLLKDQGSLGINERPELNVDGKGEYFSVAMWRGTVRKLNGSPSNIDQAILNLRKGNIKAAVKNVGSAVKTALLGKAGQGRAAQRANMDALHRYFISSNVDKEGYFTLNVKENTYQDTISAYQFLDRRPYSLGSAPKQIDTFTSSFRPFGKTTKQSFDISNAIKKEADRFTNKIKKAFKNPLDSLNKISSFNLDTAVKKLTGGLAATDDASSAQTKLRFPETSLAELYENDGRVEFIRDSLKTQQDESKKYWEANKPRLGFAGQGYKPTGTPTDVDYRARSGLSRYLHDQINDTSIYTDEGETQTPDATIKAIRKSGQDLIDLRFFDFVNGVTIPFRAFIAGLTENVQPEFSDNRYIGRVERNIVYSGVSRNLSFTLYVQAFNDEEMSRIYRKLNYLTGLCYPSKYADGFMVPPFVKLTLGDLYRDQPGYFSNLTHTIDDNTSWEIKESLQAPHGITVNIGFSIIEKAQMHSNSIFYPFGTPRSDVTSYKSPNFVPLTKPLISFD